MHGPTGLSVVQHVEGDHKPGIEPVRSQCMGALTVRDQLMR